uniref:Uncharacterized protein n=1 Tax=Loa loa TaxID=7209 RepID=A0A1I7VJB7_LOALO
MFGGDRSGGGGGGGGDGLVDDDDDGGAVLLHSDEIVDQGNELNESIKVMVRGTHKDKGKSNEKEKWYSGEG